MAELIGAVLYLIPTWSLPNSQFGQALTGFFGYVAPWNVFFDIPTIVLTIQIGLAFWAVFLVYLGIRWVLRAIKLNI